MIRSMAWDRLVAHPARMPATGRRRTAAWQPGCGACGPPSSGTAARHGGDPVAGTTAAYGSFTRRTGTPRPLHATVSTPAGLLARDLPAGSAFSSPSGDNGTVEPASPPTVAGAAAHSPGWSARLHAFPFQPLRVTCVWTQTSAATPVHKANGMIHASRMPDRRDLSASCRLTPSCRRRPASTTCLRAANKVVDAGPSPGMTWSARTSAARSSTT